MSFWRGTGLIVSLELRQRVRGVAWYVLLGVFAVLVGVASWLLAVATNAWQDGGGGVFSTIVFIVLLLASLVSPALSGNAINGDREAGILATTQVTLITTTQLVIGKWLAAWVTALAFLAAAVPFLLIAVALGKVSATTITVSVLVLAVELGVVSAIGVGLSGIVGRPLLSVVVTYLVVAALSVGTLIAFSLASAATQNTMRQTYISLDWERIEGDPALIPPEERVCLPPVVDEYPVPRYDFYWPILAANPYVVVADAVPPVFDSNGYPRDLFGWISTGARQLQLAPELERVIDECADGYDAWGESPTPEEVRGQTVPSWWAGLTLHVLLAAGALGWAIANTRTPVRKLPAGTRIA